MQQHSGGRFVERHCVGAQVAQRSAAAGHRGTRRQPRTERVDGNDAQARGIVRKVPAALAGLYKHASRKLEAPLAVRRNVLVVRSGLPQAAGHALAHFSGRLAREGDRQHRVGLGLPPQKAQIALDQNLGLAGAGRRLHDERALRVQRPFADRLVSGRGHACSNSWIRLSTWYCPRPPSSQEKISTRASPRLRSIAAFSSASRQAARTLSQFA